MSIYNKITGTDNATSAGTYTGAPDEPEGLILKDYFQTPDFFELMEKNGMFLRDNKTRKLSPEMIDLADIVVNMAEEPYIPDFLRNNKKVLWWDVENPSFATKEVSESTYSKIEGLVKTLL